MKPFSSYFLLYDHLHILECLWEGRRSYFFLLRNLIARQATCQEAVFFSRGNAMTLLTLKDYIKGDSPLQPLPHNPFPHLGRNEARDFRQRVEAGDTGNLGLISPSLTSMLDPTQEFPARTSTPSHKHKHCRVCLPNLQVLVQFLPSPQTHIHSSSGSNWE